VNLHSNPVFPADPQDKRARISGEARHEWLEPADAGALDGVRGGRLCFHGCEGPLDPFSYRRAVGRTVDLTLILSSIELLKKGKVEHEFRMTVVPGVHTEEDILLLGRQLRAGRRVSLQNFNPENPLDPHLKKNPPLCSRPLKRTRKRNPGDDVTARRPDRRQDLVIWLHNTLAINDLQW